MILQVVSSGQLRSGSEDAALARLVEQAVDAANGGADLFQLREPHLGGSDLTMVAARLVAASAGTAMRIIVNDRLDVAIAAGAHGVHLKARSLPPALVRHWVPRAFVVGLSVHSVEEARRAEQSADYLIAGTVWATKSKPEGHPTLGLDGLRAIASIAAVPVLAIGGLTLERLGDVAHAGARGIAAIGLFAPPPPGHVSARGVRETVMTARQMFDTVRTAS